MKVDIGKYKKNGRKEKVRIDKHDTYNMRHTLAIIIHPILVQFKEKTHSHPCNLTEEEWDNILSKIIWSFEQLLDEDNDRQFSSGTISVYWEKLPSGFYKMKKKENHDYSFDHEAYKAHCERIQEGLNLFGEWYRSFWI